MSQKSQEGHVDAVARAISKADTCFAWEELSYTKKMHYRLQARSAMDAAFNYWREAQSCNEQGSASPEMPVAPPARSTE